jgi:hypothetical protein
MEDPGAPVSLPISDVLDLHTVPPRDAKAIAEEFLYQAQMHGFPCARIIHGKGIGVQRQMVRTLLNGLPFVATYADAPTEAGGWGATVVTFSQSRTSGKAITTNPLTDPGYELHSLRQQFNDILAEAEALVGALSPGEFNRSPQPGAWSIAQCLGHLNKTDGFYAARAAEAIAAGKRDGIAAKGPFRYPWLERYFLRKIEPPAAFRVKAPKAFVPAPNLDPQECLAEFRKWNRELVRLREEAEGLDLRRIRVPSPAGGWLKWSLGTVFLVCAAHGRRHLHQARQVLARIR